MRAERDAVLDAIRRLQAQHDSMEYFGARSERPLETCLAEVRRSDLLVVIVGHRYGAIAPETGRSYSGSEYDEGFGLHKPCLVYLRSDDVPVLPKHVERDPEKGRLLDRWKGILRQRHTVAAFRGATDLALQVSADIGRASTELDQAVSQSESQKRAFETDLINLVAEATKAGVGEAQLLAEFRRSAQRLVASIQEHPAKVFVTYAGADLALVSPVVEGLQNLGIDVWFAPERLRAGSRITESLSEQLHAADVVIYFLSRQTVSSSWAQGEFRTALMRRIKGESLILPVILDDVEVPPLLRDIQWVDMRDANVSAAVVRLADAIRGYRGQNQTRG
jgi:hypothetical protein